MKHFFQKNRFQLIIALAGAVGGFLYWKFIGCENGTCAIKSVWYWTTLWGAAVGYLSADFILDIIEKGKKMGDDKV